MGSYLFNYSGSSALSGPENITAPLGTYRALKVHYDYTVSGYAGNQYFSIGAEIQDWYVNALGLIRESSGASNLGLVSTNVPLPPGGAIQAQLYAGWNLIGNGTAAALDVATLFGDPAKVITVWKWISGAKPGWAFYASQSDNVAAYAAAKGYALLTTIYAGEGFWVNATRPYSVSLGLTGLYSTSQFRDGARPSGTDPLPPGWSLIAV